MSLKNPYKSGGMFEGASHIIFENAKRLRKNMTNAEEMLWIYLRRMEGLKFRRQHPIGIYIADFYCHKAKLIIELDGSIHEEATIKENDKNRETQMEKWGYSIVRFTNQQVITDIENVLDSISITIRNINNIQKLNAPSEDGV